MIINYTLFQHNMEFTKWQQENPNIKLLSIIPMASGIDMNSLQDNENTCKFDAAINVQVFVTYYVDDSGKEVPF